MVYGGEAFFDEKGWVSGGWRGGVIMESAGGRGGQDSEEW